MNKAKIKLLAEGQGMAYMEAGEGAALVLVHGSLCDYRFWQPQLRGLDGLHVIAPSLAHYYPRLPSASRLTFSWDTHVEQVAAFIRHLGGPRVHLAGHSRGASIAWQAALRYPQLLRSLTLIDPGGPLTHEETRAYEQGQQLRARAAALIDQGEVDEGLRLFVDSVSRPGTWDRSGSAMQDMMRDNATTLPLQFADPLPPYRRADATSVDLPTLLVDGERSPAMFGITTALLAAWTPQAHRVTIAGASHGLTTTHAQAFNRELLKFLHDLDR